MPGPTSAPWGSSIASPFRWTPTSSVCWPRPWPRRSPGTSPSRWSTPPPWRRVPGPPVSAGSFSRHAGILGTVSTSPRRTGRAPSASTSPVPRVASWWARSSRRTQRLPRPTCWPPPSPSSPPKRGPPTAGPPLPLRPPARPRCDMDDHRGRGRDQSQGRPGGGGHFGPARLVG